MVLRLTLLMGLILTLLVPTGFASAQTGAPNPQDGAPQIGLLPANPETSSASPSNDPNNTAETENSIDPATLTPADLQSLPALKAVLVVGPVDGAGTGPATNVEIVNMEKLAAELSQRGVAVSRFYAGGTGGNNWASIAAAANGAHFFSYRGHGVAWPDGTVGGFYLDGGQFIDNNKIKSELKLAKNAVVMIWGCYTAGSGTNADGSVEIISADKARERVSQYSAPFFANGAGAYYADWFGDSFTRFVTHLFAGMTVEQAYKADYFRSAGLTMSTLIDYPTQPLYLDKYNTGYDHALAGIGANTLTSLFGGTPAAPATVAPANVTVLVDSRTGETLLPVVIAASDGSSFTWTAAENTAWMNLLNASGSAGQALNITTNAKGMSTGEYKGSVQIHASGASLQADQTMTVTMRVVSTLNKVYLPFTKK